MMNKQKKTGAVQYKINDIRELEIHIPLLSVELIDNFDEQKLDYGFNFDYHWDLNASTFSVVTEVHYVYDREHLNETFLEYTAEVEYQVPELSEIIDVQRNEMTMSEEFLAILTGIAFSTVRGMVATRTLGKFQGDFHIPIISPILIVKQYLKTQKAGV